MYIVFEGIDGSGKTTQSEFLKSWIEELGLTVEKVIEPSSNEVGSLIRKMLRDSEATTENFQKVLGLLFAADRLILNEEIRKKEVEGTVIISDRSFYSSLAYQKPEKWIAEINKYAKKPDLVLIFDLDIKTAIKRCDGHDTFEKEEFLKQVKENYIKLAKNNSETDFIIIDASNGLKKVQSDIKKAVAPYIGVCKSNIL